MTAWWWAAVQLMGDRQMSPNLLFFYYLNPRTYPRTRKLALSQVTKPSESSTTVHRAQCIIIHHHPALGTGVVAQRRRGLPCRLPSAALHLHKNQQQPTDSPPTTPHCGQAGVFRFDARRLCLFFHCWCLCLAARLVLDLHASYSTAPAARPSTPPPSVSILA